MRSTGSGVPLLSDCLAWLECRAVARYDTGDRSYFWADVAAGEQVSSGEPLCEQGLIAAATDEQKQLLAKNRRDDAD